MTLALRSVGIDQEQLHDRYDADANIVPSRYARWNRCMDLLVATVLIPLAAPLTLFLVLLVRFTSRGPGVFCQRRVGRHGTVFTILKLRTMYVDAEVRTGAVWAKRNDPRITPLGYWLRKLHLDEIPQLWNVLRGDMSLVGPRPERPEFVGVLTDEIPGYMNRLAVLPGVTGLAQINLPPDTDLDSVRRKQMLDIEYVGTASLWLDVRMLAATLLRMVGLNGEWAMSLMCVRRRVKLPGENTSQQQPLSDTMETKLTETVEINRPPVDSVGRNGNGRARHGAKSAKSAKEFVTET